MGFGLVYIITLLLKLLYLYTDFCEQANSKTAQAMLVIQFHMFIIYLYNLT